MASFPGNVPSFTVLVDDQDDILAEHQNTPNGEITSIATFLGPIGSGLNQSYSTDVLGFLLGAAKTTFQISYVDADTVKVSTGVALVTNAGGSQRVLRKNDSTTNLTGADLDSGGPTFAVSTRYYVYCDADAASNASDFIVSTNSSAPSGVTRYLQIGRFDTNSSGDVIENSVTSTTIWDSAPAGTHIQMKQSQRSDVVSITTTVPDNTSNPQTSETQLIFTVPFYPVYANSIIMVEINLQGEHSGADYIVVALYLGASTSAIAAGYHYPGTSGSLGVPVVVPPFKMTAGAITELSFTVRVGTSTNTFYLNGNYAGTQYFGGVGYSSIKITEIKVAA